MHDTEAYELFCTAIEANDVEQVKSFLASGVDAMMGLLAAIAKGDLAMAKLMLAYGADVNAEGWMGQNSLLQAIDGERYKFVPLLLQHGASANQEDERGRTALMLLYRRGYAPEPTPEIRVTFFPRPRIGLKQRWTRIVNKISNSWIRPSIADLLRRAGGECYDADPTRRRTGATWRLMDALRVGGHGKNYRIAMDAIDRGVDLQEDGDRILRGVCATGEVRLLQRIIACGIDPASALHEATDGVSFALLGPIPMLIPVRILNAILDAGADIELRDTEGRTPLHVAVDALNVKAVDALLTRGADVHARSNNGWTALDWLTARAELQRPYDLPEHPLLFYLYCWPVSRGRRPFRYRYNLVRELLTQSGAT